MCDMTYAFHITFYPVQFNTDILVCNMRMKKHVDFISA